MKGEEEKLGKFREFGLAQFDFYASNKNPFLYAGTSCCVSSLNS